MSYETDLAEALECRARTLHAAGEFDAHDVAFIMGALAILLRRRLKEPTAVNGDLFVEDEAGGKHERAKRRTRIAADWQPDAENRALCESYGIACDQFTAEFVSYWSGEGKPKADWQATFRNRLVGLARNAEGRSTRSSNGNHRRRDKSLFEATKDLIAEDIKRGGI